MKKQTDNLKNFEQFFNKKEKVFINGFEYYLDREKLMIYNKEDDNVGISIFSKDFTENERQQVLDYIKYGRE